MEFRTLINTHYSIYRDWALPHLGEGGKGESEERGDERGGKRREKERREYYTLAVPKKFIQLLSLN